MEIDIRKVVYMLIYYYPHPSTELIERIVWVYERNGEVQSLSFEWDSETPVSRAVRLALDELLVGNHIKKIKTAPNTTGNPNWRNYIWETMGIAEKCPYYDTKLFDLDTRKVFRVFQSNPKKLDEIIINNKNSSMTKQEMYQLLLDEFGNGTVQKRSKSAKKHLRV